MDPNTRRMAAGAAGAAGGDDRGYTVMEDVFRAHSYRAAGSPFEVVTGIDLQRNDGLILVKGRDVGSGTFAFDTLTTNPGQWLQLDTTAARTNEGVSFGLQSFTDQGFNYGNGWQGENVAGTLSMSYTFRKHPGFFDVLTYTGTGSAQAVPHELGTTPSMVWIKPVTAVGNWYVYFSAYGKNTYWIMTNDPSGSDSTLYTSNPDSLNLNIGSSSNVNSSGVEYVAYIWGEGQTFGPEGDSYNGTISVPISYSSGGLVVDNLGMEPQFSLVKSIGGYGVWNVTDQKRGAGMPSTVWSYLDNSSNGDQFIDGYGVTSFTGNGWVFDANSNLFGSDSFITFNLRAPSLVPSTGAEVFEATYVSNANYRTIPFEPDLAWSKSDSTSDTLWGMRKQQRNVSTTSRNAGVDTVYSQAKAWGFWDENYQWKEYLNSPGYQHLFKQARKFMWTGNWRGTGGGAFNVRHGLEVVPEIIWVKGRTVSTEWVASYPGASITYYMDLHSDRFAISGNPVSYVDDDMFQVTSPFNNIDQFYQYTMWASCPGVSKCGQYIATGSNMEFDCGFEGPARFVLIKRIDTAGDWNYWSTATGFDGVGASNCGYLTLNEGNTVITGTDYVRPSEGGFTVMSSGSTVTNWAGSAYMYLAIS